MKKMTVSLCRKVEAYATIDFEVPNGADADTVVRLAKAAYMRSYAELDGTALDFEPDYSGDDPVRFVGCTDPEVTARLRAVDVEELQRDVDLMLGAQADKKRERLVVRRSAGDAAVVSALDAEWRQSELPAILKAFTPAMQRLEPRERIIALARAINDRAPGLLYFGAKCGDQDALGYWLTASAERALKDVPRRLRAGALEPQ